VSDDRYDDLVNSKSIERQNARRDAEDTCTSDQRIQQLYAFFRGTSLAVSWISHAGARASRAFSLTKRAQLATQMIALPLVEGG